MSHSHAPSNDGVPKPLSEAERFYLSAHAEMPLGELAKALDRDANELAVLAKAVQMETSFERKRSPIKRNGRTVGTVSSPQSSAHMSEVLGQSPGSTRTEPKPPMVEGVICTTAGTADDPHCVFTIRK
jgi:hypothetical protein